VAHARAIDVCAFDFQTLRVRKHGFAISRRNPPELCYQISLTLQSEGAGNAGRRCARSHVWWP
jgi:hypothetical protein